MFKETILSNGIRILTEEMPGANSATLGIWVKAGSQNEQLFENGVSHFIEHMMFKGTAKYSAKEISEILEGLGGHINAYTTKEYTCYYIKVLHEYFYQALEVLVDMFFNSLFRPEDIEREKCVICEEIRSYEDAPDEIVHDFFARALWGNQPLGRPILGTVETTMNLNRDVIYDYLERQYIAPNIVVSACGNLIHQEIVDKIGPVFEGARKGLSVPAEALETKPSSIVCAKPGEQVQLCLGTPGISHKDEDFYNLVVLNNILGGGLSSRLFQEIREDRGLAYSIYSYTASYFKTGYWCVHAGTSPENVTEVLDLCLKVISDVKRNNVTQAEVDRCKQQIRGELLLSMESTTNHMSRLGKSVILYNRVIPVEEMVESILQVQPENIHNLARRLYRPENFALAIVGPCEEDFSLACLSSMEEIV